MKMLTVAALIISSSAFAQSGPPAGFFGNAPNVGGTLYLTFCTPAGWPCHDFEQKVYGQICYASFANSYAKDHGGNTIFTHYTSWKCPGFVASEDAKKYGYADGGPAE